ncbi:uncharacterized protein LOC101745903 [Bombyx mori]|uniref:Uncharacterized protein n=1 Tax=Bombyx mori TaxID=7091 RepID=A0A8R1WGJ7_BOMMO|nr:uncharacterized protein LOC101745903 [Bombyx mori]
MLKMSAVKLNKRIAEETQLLAEEKWITDALSKIKKQRNCLQIERLHLESMKSQLKLKKSAQQNSNVESNVEQPSTESPTREFEFEVPIINEDCNNEELNLSMGNLVDTVYYDVEVEEDEDEEINGDDLLIDMNMFMNGTQ